MTEPIRIANCSGFYGDRRSAAREMVEDGPIHALTGDWLAELTMLILARTQAKYPGAGFARTFVQQMEEVMGTCLDQGIKVVSNAGGLDPDHCAEAVQEVAEKLGFSPTIAYVNGDNLLPRLAEFRDAGIDIMDLETGEPVSDIGYISANAYLGAWGIVDALERGADIVVTGRTTDAAIVCGPAAWAWHHGWGRDDLDAMAGAVVAGHVIECGTQATGGNYSFFTEIDGLERPRLPVRRDRGRRVLGHRQTRRHRRRCHGRNRDDAALVRDRWPRLPRSGCDRSLRHHRGRAAWSRPCSHLRHQGGGAPRRR